MWQNLTGNFILWLSYSLTIHAMLHPKIDYLSLVRISSIPLAVHHMFALCLTCMFTFNTLTIVSEATTNMNQHVSLTDSASKAFEFTPSNKMAGSYDSFLFIPCEHSMPLSTVARPLYIQFSSAGKFQLSHFLAIISSYDINLWSMEWPHIMILKFCIDWWMAFIFSNVWCHCRYIKCIHIYIVFLTEPQKLFICCRYLALLY